MIDLKETTIYKDHRIHTTQLPSGLWLTSIVNVGKRKITTADSLTDAVSRVPGEYRSEREAIQAAERYIDQRKA